jgi:hypothetical protein
MKSLPELKYCREQLTCLEKKLYALNTNEDGEQDEDVLECDAAAHIYDLVGGAYLNGTASIKELNDASKQAASRQIAWFSVDPSSAKMIERDQAKELYKLVAKKYNKGECSPHELTDAKIALEKAQKAYDITRR